MVVATFRDERLVEVVRQHWHGRDKCEMPDDSINPKEYAP
jgi:hypothetical protein